MQELQEVCGVQRRRAAVHAVSRSRRLRVNINVGWRSPRGGRCLFNFIGLSCALAIVLFFAALLCTSVYTQLGIEVC
jgi:hypothetical protein